MKKIMTMRILLTIMLTLAVVSAKGQTIFDLKPTMQAPLDLPTSLDKVSYGKVTKNVTTDANGNQASGSSLVSSEISITGRVLDIDPRYHWYYYDILINKDKRTANKIDRENYNPYKGFNGMVTIPITKLSQTLNQQNEEEERDIHEFGECPDFDADAPVGDAIMPLMVLLTVLVFVKRLSIR